jgi:integrase
MARRPEPWYWDARKGWYVQFNKKQILLGKADKKTTAPPREIAAEYHRLMMGENLLDETDRKQATVPEVCEAFLYSKQKMRATTVDGYKFFLQRFADHYPKKRFNMIRIPDVEQWVASVDSWGPSTRHNAVAMIVTLFRWARDAGYCDLNPLAGFENPYPTPLRSRAMTDEEFRALIDQARDIQFKQILMFLRETGCRPGEATAIQAAHVLPDRPVIVLPPDLHKTGRRTGRERVIFLSKDIETMVRSLAMRHPVGPLFRNSRNGQGWAKGVLHHRVHRYRTKLGLAPDLVLYLVRHAFATRHVEAGVDLVVVAKLMGHAHTSTLQSVYTHLSDGPMMAALNAATKKPSGRKSSRT